MKHSTRSNFRRRPLSRRRSGFTLLELLVALGMVAIISLSMFQSLRVAVRAKSTAEAAVAPSRSSDIAMDLIRGDLENVLPPRKENLESDALPPAYLAGNFTGVDTLTDRGQPGDDVTFFTTRDGPSHDADNSAQVGVPTGDGEVHHVELTVLTDPRTGDHVLVRRVISNILAPQEVQPDDEVLCRGVWSFNVRYYDGTSWVDTWDAYNDNLDANGNPQLPAAVEVTLELEPKGPDGTVDPQARPHRYVRIFPISCSTLINDLTTQGTTQ